MVVVAHELGYLARTRARRAAVRPAPSTTDALIAAIAAWAPGAHVWRATRLRESASVSLYRVWYRSADHPDGHSLIARLYAPDKLGRPTGEPRWLRHAAAMEAACGAVMPNVELGPRWLGEIALPTWPEPARGLLIEDVGALTLADHLATAEADPQSSPEALRATVEALARLHRLSEAVRLPVCRQLRRHGEALWRWQAITRGDELGWHARRALDALGVQPTLTEQDAFETSLIELAAWAEDLAGAFCHGRCRPEHALLTPAGVRFIDWQEAHWGVPEYDLATLAAAVDLSAELIDRYAERRGVGRRAIFWETYRRCQLIVTIESLGRALPFATVRGGASLAWRQRALTARESLLADPLTRPFGELLPA